MRMVTGSTCVTVPRYLPKSGLSVNASLKTCSLLLTQQPRAYVGLLSNRVTDQHETNLVGIRRDGVADAPYQIISGMKRAHPLHGHDGADAEDRPQPRDIRFTLTTC